MGTNENLKKPLPEKARPIRNTAPSLNRHSRMDFEYRQTVSHDG